jgi:hypothetical protein
MGGKHVLACLTYRTQASMEANLVELLLWCTRNPGVPIVTRCGCLTTNYVENSFSSLFANGAGKKPTALGALQHLQKNEVYVLSKLAADVHAYMPVSTSKKYGVPKMIKTDKAGEWNNGMGTAHGSVIATKWRDHQLTEGLHACDGKQVRLRTLFKTPVV